jgi:hypothetical protein
MPSVQIADPPAVMLKSDQVSALGITEKPEPGTVYSLTGDAVVESVGMEIRPGEFAMRLRFENVQVEA